MSVSNVVYETSFFSPAIPTLPQFRNCFESGAGVCSFTTELNPQLIRKATKEPSSLLKRVDSREVTSTARSFCLYGLTSGIVASFLTKNPLLLLLGLSECFPSASAQQKVGNEFQVNTYTSSGQSSPSVTGFSNGNFAVTWTSNGQDGDLQGIFGQLFDGNSTKIGGEFQVNSYTNHSQLFSSVASFSNGNFVVTWQSEGQDGDLRGIFGQLFDGNGSTIGNEFQANTHTTDPQEYPSVASLANGNFVVTWQSSFQDGSWNGIYGQLFDGNGSIIGSEFRINSYIANSQVHPSTTSFNNGNFVVTWESSGQDSSGMGVYGQLFNSNGVKIGTEFQVNSYTANDQVFPSVSSFSNGNFVVAWESESQDGSLYGIYGQLFDGNGSTIGSEFRANSYTTSFQRDPSVASLANDNFVVTWNSDGQDGSRDGVYGQLFDDNGNKLGSEFRVNSYTTSYQRFPSVVSLANGNFVVTWNSDGQDGSSSGVYGQIFDDHIIYPSSSTIISSSTTSTSTSSTTSSVSSSTISAIGRTKTSVNPSSSTIVPSITRPITTSSSKATLSATSDSSNRFSWIWFLLGGFGVVSCLGLTGYFIFKSRDRKKDGDAFAFALEKSELPDHSTAESDYQYTPDFVTERAGQEPHYGLTPDVVAAVSDYQFTSDVMT